MITVNSLSGGKTSSYIAANYPADYNVFALVRTNDKNCLFPDKKIRQIVSDKLGVDFVGTLEMDNIITIMLDLEQYIGKEITWVSGSPFENIIKGGARNNIGKNGKYYLPNIMVRYCTEHLKMKPIFDWWKNKINQIVEMRIGFRANETKRASKMISKLNLRGFDEMKTIIGSRGTRNKWGMIEWRKPTFPLIKDQIYKDKIENYWQTNKEVRFEKGYYNNCVGCFHRNAIFLKKMSEEHPRKMEWFANIEEENFPNKFKKDITYKEIMNHKKQFEIEWEDFSDCDSGFCGI